MSWDLLLVTNAMPSIESLDECVPHGLVLDGSLEGSRSQVALRQGDFVVCTVEGPFPIDDEAEPELLAVAVGPQCLFEVSASIRASAADRAATTDFAVAAARRFGGALWDPQTETVLWPATGRRPKPPKPVRQWKSTVQAQWVTWSADLAGCATDVVGILERRLPEALPVRFGDGSLRQRVDETFDSFTNAWEEAAFADQYSEQSCFWRSATRGVGGAVSFPYSHDRNSAFGGIPAASLKLEFQMAPLASEDSRWRTAYQDTFLDVCRATKAFYARAIPVVEPTDITAGELISFGHAPSAVWRDRWLGIPRYPAWLVWLGPHLRKSAGLRPNPRGQPGCLLHLTERPDHVGSRPLIPGVDTKLYRRDEASRRTHEPESLSRQKREAPTQPVPYHPGP